MTLTTAGNEERWATPARSRIAIVGAAGSIAESLSRELSKEYEVLAVTGIEARARAGDPEGRVHWQYCDLFSLTQMKRILAGSRYAIFMAHSGLPNSRFHQANCGDMDLLMAENFARAADAGSVEHIYCLRSLLPTGGTVYEAQIRHHQIGDILGASKTPATVICSGLVVDPGSAIVRLVMNLVRRSHFLPVPRWGLHAMQPIAVDDLVRAFLHCLRQPSQFVGKFEIGGPDKIHWQEFLEETARLLGVTPRFFRTNRISPAMYARWLRQKRPGAHPEALQLFVENLQFDTVARDNRLQRTLQPDLQPALDVITRGRETGEVRQTVRFRSRLRSSHDQQLKDANTVRSIQRVKLPPGRDATWLSRRYFTWLSAFLKPLVRCRQQGDSSYCMRVTGLGACLLRLEFSPERSSDERLVYTITDGLLASSTRNRHGRMEFRSIMNGDYAIIAIHEFAPALPWHLYLTTQAAIHHFVMSAFQRYLESRVC